MIQFIFDLFLSSGLYKSMDSYNFLVWLYLPPTLSLFFKSLSASPWGVCQTGGGQNLRGPLLVFFRTYVDDHKFLSPLDTFTVGELY